MVSDLTKDTLRILRESISSVRLNHSLVSDILDIGVHVLENEGDEMYFRKIGAYVKELCHYGMDMGIDYLALNELLWKCRRIEAPYVFESFLLYMEKNRPLKERFYENRIKPLSTVCEAIQQLADDLLDELFINMPSRVGKTQIVKLAMVWFGAKNIESSNLYTAFSDKITRGFYDGINELTTDTTYCFKEIFPNIVKFITNGDNTTVDLNRKRTYPTFTCRSIYGTLNGACDCNGLAIADDLFSGIQEAMNPALQEKVWGIFDNNFMKRLKEGAKLISMGTRWAVKDVMGRRLSLLEENEAFKDKRYKVITIPALDENDESNFEYPFKLGYSTTHYKQVRASFFDNGDEAGWFAQCQQEPIERLGANFSTETTKIFRMSELPGRDPDRIFMAIDIAFGGGDYVAAPVCYQYDNEFYILDVVYDKRNKKYTQPLVADAILRHGVAAACFEETKTTDSYRNGVEDILENRGYKCNSYGKAAPSKMSKAARINDATPEIQEMYFLATEERSKPYHNFMNNLYSYKTEGNNKNDDAPDSLAQLCKMKLPRLAKVTATQRMF